jgi:hypothetical protein
LLAHREAGEIQLSERNYSDELLRAEEYYDNTGSFLNGYPYGGKPADAGR